MARARRRPLDDKRHDELAAKIQAWAEASRFVDNPYVIGISSALKDKKDLQIWAELDPFELLPRKIEDEGAVRARVSKLTLIRNLLVFAPVALTWLAVAEATAAFGEFTEANPESIANFLDFWQDGYGYLASWSTIDHVAMLDFAIVMAVIALTGVIFGISNKSRQRIRIAQEVSDAKRMEIALSIQSYLHDKRQINNVTFNKSIVTSINRLLNATDHIETSTRALQRTIADRSRPSRKQEFRSDQPIELPERLKRLLES